MSDKFFDKATQEWVQVRKKLYLQVKASVRNLLGRSWEDLVPLEKRYHREIQQSWRLVSTTELYEGLAEAQMVLLGDFHALQQSQRGHLRLLRDWPGGSHELVLAVEFFQAKHQKWIDLYLKGRITEKSFLQKIDWTASWGFPWENYKPLVDWAKAQGVPLMGINWSLKQTQLRSIQMREQFSAVSIQKIHQRFPDRKIMIIYGDLHLVSSQLPAAIRKQLGRQRVKIRRVFQNNEALYFQSLKKGLEHKVEHVQLKNGDYCIQSVPPWVKWQSYLMFLENTYDRQIDETEVDLDPTDHVAKLASFLMQEYRIKGKASTLAVYSADDTGIYLRLRRTLPRSDWKVVQVWLTRQRSFYIPELQSGYLGRLTVNHTAALAGEFVHAQFSKRNKIYLSGASDFEAQIWIQAMAYLGSKVINHKRRADSVEDLRRSLLLGDAKEGRRKVLILALRQKVREIRFMTSGRMIPLQQGRLERVIYMEAARLLGAMLGEKIYNLYREKKWTLKRLREKIQTPMEGAHFRKEYYQIIQGVAESEAKAHSSRRGKGLGRMGEKKFRKVSRERRT